MKSIFLLIFFSILSAGLALAQDEVEEKQQFKFHLGLQTRVTPIYVKGYPNAVFVTDRNIWETPDRYLSGPSVLYKIERKTNSSWSVSFSQAIRYDFLYRTLPYNNQPIQPFKIQTKRAVITDFYLDGETAIPLRNSHINVGAGLALCGIGSGYLLTQRFVDNNNQSFYITSKEDFVFPAITASVGWQKNKLSALLKMGYAWYNPTLFHVPFLFPELKVQYQLFSF